MYKMCKKNFFYVFSTSAQPSFVIIFRKLFLTLNFAYTKDDKRPRKAASFSTVAVFTLFVKRDTDISRHYNLLRRVTRCMDIIGLDVHFISYCFLKSLATGISLSRCS